MVEIKNTEVFGLERSLLASGNPMSIGEINTKYDASIHGDLSEIIAKRGASLGSVPTGTGHDNYLKGITVMFDIKYSGYITPEMERYNWLDIVSSQSSMHRLTNMGLRENFHDMFNKYVDVTTIDLVKEYIKKYNTTTDLDEKYYWFMKAVSNLPKGFEMMETVTTNYLQLKTIYHQRKNHKLKEDWGVFCDWILSLPKFKELVLKKENTNS